MLSRVTPDSIGSAEGGSEPGAQRIINSCSTLSEGMVSYSLCNLSVTFAFIGTTQCLRSSVLTEDSRCKCLHSSASYPGSVWGLERVGLGGKITDYSYSTVCFCENIASPL